jgi:phosphoribosylamine--glycine ligase
MRIQSDLLEALLATAEHRLDEVQIEFDTRPAICVVMSSAGYPGPYEKGFEITGIDQAEADPDVKVFHAGTAMKNNALVTNGGRVLGVTARGETLTDAQEKAYGAVTKIAWQGAYWRNDIGDKAISEGG